MGAAPGGVLALDLSLRTGWAYGHDHAAPVHGVWVLGKTADLGAVFSGLAGELQDAIAVLAPSVVLMEAPLPPQAQTAAISARLQFGLAAVTEMICHEAGVPCEEERAQTVRKLVLGHSRVEKQDIMDWCGAEGYRPAEHNDGDALVLLRYRHIIGRSRVMAGAGSVVF